MGDFDFMKDKKYEKLEKKFMKMFNADEARISKPIGKLFLIVGYKKHTKDDRLSYFEKNGKRIDFEYLQETVIASGNNAKELMRDAKELKSLLKAKKMEVIF